MAFYKYDRYLTKDDGSKFDEIHEPGESTPHSGIYRCENCSHEVVSVVTHPLPPQNHHQHESGRGPIRWRLVVW